MLDTLNQNATQFRQAVTDVVTDPVGTMLPIIPMIGKGVGEMINQGGPFGSPAARAATQPPDAQPPAPQAPPPTGSTSLSASAKTPGKGAGFKSPDFENERNMLQEAYTTQNLANALLADQQSDLLTKKAELLRKRQDEEAALAARQAAMESARSERMKRGEAGLAQLQSRLMELENQSPDPNRFWNNKDAGQKAAAVIAGALFGFTGQGMQWLQRLDGLVEADIQQQAQELQRKGGLLGKQIDVQNNLVAMARQQGLDEAESISAARIAMMNKYATMFEQAAATTGSEAVKTQALANSAVLREKMARDMMDMKLKTTEAAQKAALTAAQVNHLNAQTFAAKLAAVNGAKGGETPPGIRTEIAKIDAGLKAVREARAAVGSDQNLGQKALDQLALNIGDTLRTLKMGGLANLITPDTSSRDYAASGAQENVLKAVKGENLLENDIERAQPRWLRPGFSAENNAWLNSMEEQLIAKRNSLVASDKESSLVPMESGLRTLAPSGK